jgi:hypothetical protein
LFLMVKLFYCFGIASGLDESRIDCLMRNVCRRADALSCKWRAAYSFVTSVR